MISERYRGYLFHSRQPCMRHAATIDFPELRNTEIIDSWLIEYFGIAAEKLAEPPVHGEDRAANLVRCVLRRALAVYEELLIGSLVPCFDSGKIIRIEGDGRQANRFRVQLALPTVDNVPSRFFAYHFSQCLRLIQGRLLNEPKKAEATALLDELQENVIEKIKTAMPFWGSALPVYAVASWENVPYRHLGNGVMRIGYGSRSRLLWDATTSADSVLGARMCRDKWQTARVLRDAGLPGANNVLVKSQEEAIAAIRELGWPVVVKPNDHEQSAGVSVGITDEGELRRAYDRARKLSANVLVEQHAPGLCYRIMVAADQLIYVVARIPKSVVGNGKDTVNGLVSNANKDRLSMPPWKRMPAFPMDDEAVQTLAGQELSLTSVPSDGQRVFLRPITSGDLGGRSENRTAEIHPANTKLAIDAARLIGVSFAGVDLITTDIARPWFETGAVINELNFNPQFMTVDREKDARSLMPALIEGDGRIPVHLVTGIGDLYDKAMQLRDRLSADGHQCIVTSADHTIDVNGKEIVMEARSLFERSLGLTMRSDVNEIIMAGTLDEAFSHGLAVDGLDRVYVSESERKRGRQIMRAIRARTPLRRIQLLES